MARSQGQCQDLADGAKDETEKQEFQQKADQASNAAEHASGTINAARSSIESSGSGRDAAASSAMDQIEQITSSDDLNDGWWDNWALAGVLIVIAAVAAIVSAVANITLAATGERSWGEAGLAIAGATLSVIGLAGAAKAATGLAKGVSKGALRSGRTASSGSVPAS